MRTKCRTWKLTFDYGGGNMRRLEKLILTAYCNFDNLCTPVHLKIILDFTNEMCYTNRNRAVAPTRVRFESGRACQFRQNSSITWLYSSFAVSLAEFTNLRLKYCKKRQPFSNKLSFIPMFYPLIGDISIGNFISRSVKNENTVWI